MIKRLLVFVALVMVTGACSSSPGQLPSAPSAGPGKLTVALSSKSGTPISGTISLFDQTDKVVDTKFVEAGSNAIFSNLAAGNYRVTGVGVFGWQAGEARLSIEGREEQVQLQLDPVPYDIRLREVLVNGQILKPGEVVSLPANLTFRVEVMNGVGRPVVARVRVFGDPVLEGLGAGASDAIQPGLQEVTVTLPNFQACSDSGRCFDRSRLVFLYVGDYPYQGANIHRETEVPLTYSR